MSVWKEYIQVNESLKQDFLCIPPYRSVNGKFVHDVFLLRENSQKSCGMISASINNPWQRAFQFEYCYKECDVFLPFLQIIEYATYDAMVGNWICAYLSLIPTVEAIMRKWFDEKPDISFEGMKKSPDILKKIGIYTDERKTITEEQIKYLTFILGDLYFNRFKEYKECNYDQIFNRNLSLHKLEGVSDISEGLRNITRIFLVLDIIAELYLMQDSERYQKYWNRMFYSQYDEVDFQLRWKLYLKASKDCLYSSDINIIQNCFYGSASGELKKNALDAINLHMEVFEENLKRKKKE